MGFVWRVGLGRIPSVEALQSQGVAIQSVSCGRCGAEPENVNHILFFCPFATAVRYWISQWCKVDLSAFNDIGSFLNFVRNWGRCPKQRRILVMICYGLLWNHWKARNERIFKNASCPPLALWMRPCPWVFLWIKNRSSFGLCNWNDWCISPFL